jgi:hypothetical protein
MTVFAFDEGEDLAALLYQVRQWTHQFLPPVGTDSRPVIRVPSSTRFSSSLGAQLEVRFQAPLNLTAGSVLPRPPAAVLVAPIHDAVYGAGGQTTDSVASLLYAALIAVGVRTGRVLTR